VTSDIFTPLKARQTKINATQVLNPTSKLFLNWAGICRDSHAKIIAVEDDQEANNLMGHQSLYIPPVDAESFYERPIKL